MTTKLFPALGAALTVALATTGACATSSCSFQTVVGVAFGSYDTFGGSPLDSAGSITFTCQNVGVADTIVIDLSRGNASGFFPRKMLRLGTAFLYNLYLDAARTVVWGDGTSGTSHYGPVNPPSGSPVTVSVYGRVPAGQNVAAGSYSDTIVATVLF
jgi:spore coat protein U-like protein